jgi:agmatine deiminase
MMDTPASLGYMMPAEWEKHDATWLSWPKDPSTFPGEILPKVEGTYVKMIEALGGGEEVRVLVEDAKMEARVSGLLRGADRVSYHRLKTVDVWVRDYGPIYVRGRDVAVVKWVFNAWGDKYEDLKPDNAAGERIAESTGLRVFRPEVVLEGGSVDLNGGGSLLTTEQCLLNPNRNPNLKKGAITSILGDYLGGRNVVWLGEGIVGDDTDGHVDDIARFVSPRRVLVASEPNESDPNHGVLVADRKLLEAATDERGRPLEVATLPMPEAVLSSDGRLPASHLNFYIGNECVLVPNFGGESDRKALKALEEVFPRRRVVGIDCRALVYGLGTIHCVTQQVPAGPRPPGFYR